MTATNLTNAQLAEAIKAVAAHGGNITNAAHTMGLPRPTLQHRLRTAKLRLNVQQAPDAPAIVVLRPKPIVRVKAGTGASYRVLGIGDSHDSPALPKDRFRWMGRHAAETGAEVVVQIGDMFTFDSLNSHIPNDTLLAKQKSPWRDDMGSAVEAMGEFRVGLGQHKPRLVKTRGNHERRIETYENFRPEMAGVLTGELDQITEDAGWEWTPYGEFFFLGGVGFVHAALNTMGKTYGGKTAEQRITNDAVFDIVIGHSHVGRVWRSPKIGPSQWLTCVNLGCALPWGHVEDYALHATTGWTYGVYDLLITGGRIESAAFISMLDLERRYADSPPQGR